MQNDAAWADCHYMYLILVAAQNVDRYDQSHAVLELIGPSCFQYNSVKAIFSGCKAITITLKACDPPWELLVFTVLPNGWQKSVC